MFHEDGQLAGDGMDPPCDPPCNAYAVFEHNFAKRYAGNRAPFGIFLHAGWLAAHAAAS